MRASRGWAALGALALLAATPAISRAATSTSTFVWTAGDATNPSSPTYDPNWSDPNNWQGGVAPSPDSTVTIVFPQLACGAACPVSVNDVPGLTADLVANVDYAQAGTSPAGTQIQGPYGITIAGFSETIANRPTNPSVDPSPTFTLPMTLATDQTWHLDGGCASTGCTGLSLGPRFENTVSGLGALTVELGHSIGIAVHSMNVGPVSIQGVDTSVTGNPAGYGNGSLFLFGSTLNDNANPVTVTNAGLIGFGTVGPLHLVSSDLQPNWAGNGGSAQPLQVHGPLVLDHTTFASWPFLSNPSQSSNLSPVVTVTGGITVTGTALSVGVGCDVPAGTTFPLLDGSAFTGQFAAPWSNQPLPDGAVFQASINSIDRSCAGVGFGNGQWVQLHYTGTGATITVVDSPFTITTTSLPNATIAQPYSATLAATGGTQPYHWSIASGHLPSNLSLSPSGVISGTPLLPATSTFTVQVTDSAAPAHTATRTFSITVGTGTPADPVLQPVGTEVENVGYGMAPTS